jgi:hypothetical protein
LESFKNEILNLPPTFGSNIAASGNQLIRSFGLEIALNAAFDEVLI